MIIIMSLFFGYEDRDYESDKILRRAKRHLDDDPKLSISGGKMTGNIDMDHYAIKNVPAAIDVGDPISKQVLEIIYLSQYFKTQSYNVIFDFNTTKYAVNMVDYHRGTNVVKVIGDKKHTSPILGSDNGNSFLYPDLTHPCI